MWSSLLYRVTCGDVTFVILFSERLEDHNYDVCRLTDGLRIFILPAAGLEGGGRRPLLCLNLLRVSSLMGCSCVAILRFAFLCVFKRELTILEAVFSLFREGSCSVISRPGVKEDR